MTEILATPNLPEGKIKSCLIGEGNDREISELCEFGIDCIEIPRNPLLDKEISNHADMLCHNLGNGYIVVKHLSTKDEKKIASLGITPLFYNSDIKSPYPYDVPLNVARIENRLVCNVKYTSQAIIKYALENRLQIINTKQGYAKCNLCIVRNNAVITEDHGIAILLKKYQFDVLEIGVGDVSLSESHYGFLGGASSKLSKNTMYFSGNIEEHRDYENIAKFLAKHQITPVFNKKRKLRDFGGIIQLTESG